uniref:Uncharacterized protein n=1 Tax=Rhizophora mucronata TaxID=61149 RepID=A0A2P2P0A1_RHIMU
MLSCCMSCARQKFFMIYIITTCSSCNLLHHSDTWKFDIHVLLFICIKIVL